MAPPRSSFPRPGSFYPPNDAATYRDLLLFEERLKTNAAILTRRKRRYRLFLAQLLAIIAFLLCEVLLQTNLLTIPYAFLLRRFLPEIYEELTPIELHPYFASGLLFVSVTTLVLFFASGMYAEKIGYANRYVPHANKALRTFNMYLNVRQPPLRSKYPWNVLLRPFSAFFSEPSPAVAATSNPSSPARRTPSPESLSTPRSPRSQSAARQITSIPPSSNPRGELIFSSRVAPAFRESYERYRAAFERKREERERERAARSRPFWARWATKAGAWTGLREERPEERERPAVVSLPPSRTPSVVQRGAGGGSRSRRSSPMTRGRARETPPPASSSGNASEGEERMEGAALSSASSHPLSAGDTLLAGA